MCRCHSGQGHPRDPRPRLAAGLLPALGLWRALLPSASLNLLLPFPEIPVCCLHHVPFFLFLAKRAHLNDCLVARSYRGRCEGTLFRERPQRRLSAEVLMLPQFLRVLSHWSDAPTRGPLGDNFSDVSIDHLLDIFNTHTHTHSRP